LILRNEFSVVSILRRTGVTVIVLSIIYIFLGPPSYVELEMINELFYLIVLPAVLISGTIFLSFLIGTPIRIIPSLFNWWYNRPYLVLIFLITGVIICLLSIQTHFMESRIIILNEGEEIEYTPNFKLLSIGWFITSFSLTHFYFESFVQFVKNKLKFNK
jgi:hypothetical protein